jgi:hypothetical protein
VGQALFQGGEGLLELADALAPPAGLRYTIVHKLLNKEVASGVTDQVGKSVIKRRGTLFVGETYVARTPGGPGISAGEASFTVDGGASSARGVEVVIEVVRACASMSFVLKPALVDTQHWARSLPLPERIGYVSKDLGARWATGRNVKGEDGPGTYKAVEVWALKVRGHNAEVVTIETHCTREQAEAWVWEGVRP